MAAPEAGISQCYLEWVKLRVDATFPTPWPRNKLAEDFELIGKLLTAVTGDELFDTGDKEDALCKYCSSHNIHGNSLKLAAWRDSSKDEYQGLVQALVWALIQKYEVSQLGEETQPAHIREVMGKDALKYWVHEACQPYRTIKNFAQSWQDGIAFIALLAHAQKALGRQGLAVEEFDPAEAEKNLAVSFDGFAELGVPKMLSVQLVLDGLRPDGLLKKATITYLSSIHNQIKKGLPSASTIFWRHPTTSTPPTPQQPGLNLCAPGS